MRSDAPGVEDAFRRLTAPAARETVSQEQEIEELRADLAVPERRAQLELFVAARLQPKYRRLFANLELDLATREALLAVIATKDLASIEACLQCPPTMATEDMLRAVGEQRASFNRRVRALIGDASFETYEYYERTLPIRRALDAFEDRLGATSVALTSAQYEQMVGVVAASDDYQRTVMPGNGHAAMGFNTVSLNETTLEAARVILSDAQYTYYCRHVEHRANAQKLAEAGRFR